MKNYLLALFASFTALFSLSAFAALDASIATAFSAVQDDAVALSAIVVPIVVAILGLLIVIKLIKRFGNKL
jgi:hypothetical protein